MFGNEEELRRMGRKYILTDLMYSGKFDRLSPDEIREKLGTKEKSIEINVEGELEKEVYDSYRTKRKFARATCSFP